MGQNKIPSQKPRKDTPRERSPADSSSVAGFRLREECSEERECSEESDEEYITPPQSPMVSDTESSDHTEDIDTDCHSLADCSSLASSESEDSLPDCPRLANSESEDSDSDSDSTGLKALCPNPTCYRAYWSDHGDCRDCTKRHEDEVKLNKKILRSRENGEKI